MRFAPTPKTWASWIRRSGIPLHGALLHQTICNNISDSNCLGDISRFAIHFEPLMLPISLLYIVAPSPKTLMLLQALVVGCGAFPVYWIACRRLQSPLAGVGIRSRLPALSGAAVRRDSSISTP